MNFIIEVVVIDRFHCTSILRGKATIIHIMWLSSCWFICLMYLIQYIPRNMHTGFVVLCFAVVMLTFIMNSHEVFIHIHQGCFAGTGAIVRLRQCQWSKPDGYGKISQCMTTIKYSKAKIVCIFLGIYCNISHQRKIVYVFRIRVVVFLCSFFAVKIYPDTNLVY